MENSILSSILEKDGVIPVFKKDKRTDNNNYQLICILLEEFRNIKSSFLTEVKSFENEFLQSCFEHSPGEEVRENSMKEISERFINHLEEQISFLKEQLRNKDKIVNSLINQLSKNSEVKQTPVVNPQDKKKITEENVTPVKQKLSYNTETINNTDSINTAVIKTSRVDFTVEKTNETEKDLSNNTDKINSKSKNKQAIRKNNDTKIQKLVIVLVNSMVKHINGCEISKRVQSECKVYLNSFQVLEQNV